MIAVAPQATAPPEGPVHSLRDPNGEALKSARERAHVHRFDKEVHVIPLDRELEDAEATARSRREPPPDSWEDGVRSQRGEPVPRAHRHVQRMARVMSWPGPVRDPDLPARRLATGAGAFAAPTCEGGAPAGQASVPP